MTRTGGDWFTSSFSAGGQCVEVRFDGSRTFVRDTKFRRDPANDLARQPVVEVSAQEWADFCLDLAYPGASDATLSVRSGEGLHRLRAPDETELVFNELEWRAFVAGVAAGEFTHPYHALIGV